MYRVVKTSEPAQDEMSAARCILSRGTAEVSLLSKEAECLQRKVLYILGIPDKVICFQLMVLNHSLPINKSSSGTLSRDRYLLCCQIILRQQGLPKWSLRCEREKQKLKKKTQQQQKNKTQNQLILEGREKI